MDITIEDPRSTDVSGVLQRHLDLCNQVAPSHLVYSLDVESLRRPRTTLFGAREGGVLLGVCALKLLTDYHAELKSMHVLAEARNKGAAGAMLEHIIGYARSGGVKQISLQTNSNEAFLPARALYEKFGFECTEAFADYPTAPENIFMSLVL